jgi:hypothetical protein
MTAALPRERLELLARRIHRLGERGLFELFRELESGAPLHERLERYGRLESEHGAFLRAMNGHRLRRPVVVAGRTGDDAA